LQANAAQASITGLRSLSKSERKCSSRFALLDMGERGIDRRDRNTALLTPLGER
jgi:hypothetical protein